jgi:hypothetical protein
VTKVFVCIGLIEKYFSHKIITLKHFHFLLAKNKSDDQSQLEKLKINIGKVKTDVLNDRNRLTPK